MSAGGASRPQPISTLRQRMLEDMNVHRSTLDQEGMAIIDAFVLKDPKGGSSLERARKDLQEKIQSLPSDLR
jgi:hypothetical protein